MAEFLAGEILRGADESTRRQFWHWLHKNGQRIGARERPTLAVLPVWPDKNGRMCRIADLCEPSSSRVGDILGASIRRPHPEVRSSKLVSFGGKARASIRRVPNEAEINAWLGSRLADVALGEHPSADAAEALMGFETDVARLISDPQILGLLRAAAVPVPALAEDGSVRLRAKLVAPGRKIDLLALPRRLLLKDGRHATALDKLSPTLSVPTGAMLLAAFSEDGENRSALHARLRQFFAATKLGDDERNRLAELPIIPVDGRLRAPSELAFQGNHWGAWKIPIPGKGLSQDEQKRYLDAGVTPSVPTREKSRNFFDWLSTQGEDVLREHISCVLRHIAHRYGPAQWAENFVDTRFVPATGRNGVCLLTLAQARRRQVFLPDAGDIGEAVTKRDHRVLLVIDQEKGVTEPISKVLRELGVKSLRETLKEPVEVVGKGEAAPAAESIVAEVKRLQPKRFQRTLLKRLNELGIERDLVRRDWPERLSLVKEIKVADQVEGRYRLLGKI